MSEPSTPQREKEFADFLKRTQGTAYSKRALLWFQQNMGKIVTARELARIPGKDGETINHNMRRVFELRDEQGYEIINWKDKNPLGVPLKVDEWILLKKEPNPKMIRDRGVNKRIMFEVFERDNFTCQSCGRTPEDDDPFRPGHKIKLHVGHLTSHKQKDGSVSNVGKELTKENFITLCNVCNEGEKNKNFKKINLIDRIESSDEKVQKEIFNKLKKKFS